jgi:hypothetical protein
MNRSIRELDAAELTAVSGGASDVSQGIETAQHIGGDLSFWSGVAAIAGGPSPGAAQFATVGFMIGSLTRDFIMKK